MNQPRSRGPIARLFIGLWDAVNFSRRLVFNLLFLLVVFVLLAAMFGGGKLAPLAERSTLVIEPEGRLVEQWRRTTPAQRIADVLAKVAQSGLVAGCAQAARHGSANDLGNVFAIEQQV